MIKCVGCRFRVCSTKEYRGKNTSWDGAEYCFNANSPHFGDPVILDENDYFVNFDGCDKGQKIDFSGENSSGYQLLTLPPGFHRKIGK